MCSPKPVAITVIRTSSPMDSSMTAPKMMLASSSASSWMSEAASFTSWRDRSGPPVMLMSTPRAPEIETSSRSGLEIAFCAASMARFSPCAIAAPVIAMPVSHMMARTSAKSRLMRPWTVIRSEIPRTAWKRTSSACLKLSRMEEFRPATASRRWFGMAMRVSQLAFNSRIPSSACFIRRLPSKMKGLVTTPTVSEPSSLVILAITGAAPVPVPPPMPAVTKIMSAPSRTSRRRSTSSWAARFPTSGLPPAPSPRVSFSPSWNLMGERLARSAWASVLAAMKSTPGSPAAIIVFTALPPPPPIPTTLIRAAPLASTNSIIAAPPPLRPGGLEELPEPPHHPLTRHADLTEHALAAAPVSVLLEPVEDETDCRRIHGTRDGVNQAAQMKRRPEPHGQPEDALGERRHVLEHRAAAGQDHPGGERLVAAGALDLGPGEHQHLLGARLDQLGEGAAREVGRRATAEPRPLDRLLGGRERGGRAPRALP